MWGSSEGGIKRGEGGKGKEDEEKVEEETEAQRAG